MARSVRFEFFPLRFEFTAREPLVFPPGKAGNILRGALGVIFRRIACVPECQDARVCETRYTCPYARVFAPVSHGEGPSGLADSPRPFVFRARHLDGCTIHPGQNFHFDLHVFSPDPGVLSYFVQTFAALACEGLGPGRGRADLERVGRIAAGNVPGQTVCEGAVHTISGSVAPASLDLNPMARAPRTIRVEFLSPTELKHEDRVTGRPEFPVLFGRIRDRISTLRNLYGGGPLDIDFQASGIRAARVRMVRCEVRRVEARRRSSRTGQSHPIGGFVGFAEYEGDLEEFLPYLEAGRWTGVGRQSVWGKGEFSIASDRLD
jgi:CRISPR-associated endoribonuclease Cas6